MITYVSGDLFDSPAKVLVNAVNTVGVMGKGIAKTFKEVYPDMFAQYQRLCETDRLHVGQLWLYKTSHKWVLNFPTKEDWRRPSRLEYIESGLRKFVSRYAENGVTSVAFPRLGCGNGELDWATEVEPLYRRHLAPLAIDVYVHHIDQSALTPEHRDIEEMKAWLRGEPRALPFSEVWADLERTLRENHRFVTPDGKSPFVLEIITSDTPGIRIRMNPETSRSLLSELRRAAVRLITALWRVEERDSIFVPEEGVLDLWQSIRASGYLHPNTMPGGLDRLADYLFPLFGRLGYFKPVDVWTSQSAERRRALALREPSSFSPVTVKKTAVALRA